MAQSNQASGPAEAESFIPRGQRFFDRIFLLLFISLLISGLLYNAWGLVEVLTAPPLPIP